MRPHTTYIGGYDDYKAKSAELQARMAAAPVAHAAAGKAAPAQVHAESPLRADSDGKRRARLELGAQLERREPEHAGDSALLASRWQEREALQQLLTSLYEQWMELAE